MDKPKTKITSLRLDDSSHYRMKLLAAHHGISISEVVEGLLNFAEAGKELPNFLRGIGITDPSTHELIEGVFEQLFIDTMEKIEERRAQWAKSKAELLYNAQKRSEKE